jgi:hypothetical protein
LAQQLPIKNDDLQRRIAIPNLVERATLLCVQTRGREEIQIKKIMARLDRVITIIYNESATSVTVTLLISINN